MLKIVSLHLSAGRYTRNYTTVVWNPSGFWTGANAVVYFSFDTLTGLRLMAGSAASNYEALIAGKVNRCVHSGKCKSMCSIRER